jgi:signal transduction histidine kinase
MSHEIRTPMNTIMGFSSILLEEKDINSDIKSYLEIIEKNSKQLLVLINDIIDFSKIEAGQISINKHNNNLNQFVRDIVESFYINTKLTKDKSKTDKVYLSCDLQLSTENAMAFFDEVRLQQILSNLIQNAIKFTEKGYIKVKYTIENDDIVFSVKDSGIGIPEERKVQIFERFRQVDNSTSRAYGGAGLGLSICQGLCKLMGGDIKVETEINKGSNFIFRIPYQKGLDN